jgi:hypothetical protein
MMSYGTELKAHLSRYKRSVLKVEEDGTWARNRRPYSHILPKALAELNLVEPIRSQCLSYMAREEIKLHGDFAHLNSSQAFAFNLFFPWLSDGIESRRALARCMGIRSQIDSWEFEAVPDQEEGTNLDLWLRLEDRSQVFIEVKLTENGFGAPKANDRRRKKLEDIYRPRLERKAAPEVLAGDVFFKHYQLLRNLSHVNPARGDLLLLIFPKANRRSKAEAEGFLGNIVLEGCRPHVRIVFAEDLFRGLQEGGALTPSVRSAMDMVGQKYRIGVEESVGV